MAKKPEPPKPIIWNVFKIASKAVFLGVIEAPVGHLLATSVPASKASHPSRRLRSFSVVLPSDDERRDASIPTGRWTGASLAGNLPRSANG